MAIKAEEQGLIEVPAYAERRGMICSTASAFSLMSRPAPAAKQETRHESRTQQLIAQEVERLGEKKKEELQRQRTDGI